MRNHPLTLCVFALLLACGDDAGSKALTAEQLLDPTACKDCHPSQFREWSGSMHAYAAEDPVFLAMNARGQRETDGALGVFCVQCHAPMAVRAGLTTDGLNLDEVPPQMKGVTCAFCHQVDAIEGTHNNPLKLALDGVMRGGIKDPIANGAHASVYSANHDREHARSADLCGSCHDIVTPAGVALENTFAEWKGSLFNSDDPVQRATCGTCHMPGRDAPAATGETRIRRVHDHTMPGVDVALTEFPEQAALRVQVQRDLDNTLITEVCVIQRAGGSEVELYLENVAAGHGVPSGAAHDRRFWVEMTAHVSADTVFESGVVGDGEPVAELDDPNLWLLSDRVFDAAGDPAHMFWDIRERMPETLPAPTTTNPADPAYINPHVPRRYRILVDDIDRIEIRVRARAIGLEILDDLIDSGDLDPAIRDAMPTFTLASTVTTWTRDAATLRISPLSGREALCSP